MDTELYQIVSVALLGLIVLVLLAVLSSLGRTRKALREALEARPAPASEPEMVITTVAEEPSEQAPAEVAPEPQPAPATGPRDEPSPAGAVAGFGAPPLATEDKPTPEPSPFDTPERVPAAQPDPQPAAETPAGAVGPWDQEEDRPGAGVGSGLGDDAGTVGAASVGAGTAASGTFDETEPSEAPSADEPQDQPFERDGRWFFRRGDELLTYEETTGQWVPADQPAAGPPSPTSTPPATTEDEDTKQFETTPASSGQPGEATSTSTGGGFWKCPSCGAVNGSTATTCRMCFTARP